MLGLVYAIPLHADEYPTILALGDSLTQGYGLPEQEGFVPQLEAWLAANGTPATVINAGVSGDTTAGGLARVEWSLTPEVDGVIVALGGNDLLRGLFPEDSRANLQGILQVLADRDLPALLAGLPGPGNYGPEFKQAFDAMYPELAEAFGALYYPNFLGAVVANGENSALESYMQSDGIHPNADGVALIVADIGPLVQKLISDQE
ncbi:MAG TPA: arylesterase [Paracoccaceae bacterium]|nr:arylesterase [Paracoccaceae bacterium]